MPYEEKNETASILQEFIGRHPNTLNYLHNAPTEDIARQIMNEGFHFEGYIEFTCDLISGYDPVELRYFLHTRGRYGSYTIIIQIGENLVNKYSEKLMHIKNHYSEILSVESLEGPDDEPVFILPPIFIKGYLDQNTQKTIENPKFDPHNDLPVFQENLNRLLHQNNQ
jgi:hypothetical protein